MIKCTLHMAGLLVGFTTVALAQKEETTAKFGGQGGANLEIEAMVPTGEAVRVGLAGGFGM